MKKSALKKKTIIREPLFITFRLIPSFYCNERTSNTHRNQHAFILTTCSKETQSRHHQYEDSDYNYQNGQTVDHAACLEGADFDCIKKRLDVVCVNV